MATAKKGEYKGYTNVVTLRTLSHSGLGPVVSVLQLLVDGPLHIHSIAWRTGVMYRMIQCFLCVNMNAVIHGVGACFWNEQKLLAVSSLRSRHYNSLHEPRTLRRSRCATNLHRWDRWFMVRRTFDIQQEPSIRLLKGSHDYRLERVCRRQGIIPIEAHVEVWALIAHAL